MNQQQVETVVAAFGESEPVAAQWQALAQRIGPGAFPGKWSHAEVERATRIMETEFERVKARMSIYGDVFMAYMEFPLAENAGEACTLAGIDPADIEHRLREIGPPDELGLRWLIDEFERAECSRQLMRIPT